MPHVLLVDDEAPLRDSLTYTLQREGFMVTTAADGHNAIRQFHRQVPDVILLDSYCPRLMEWNCAGEFKRSQMCSRTVAPHIDEHFRQCN